MAKQLTPALQDTLIAIYRFKREKGCMPTSKEVAKKLSMSPYAIQLRMENLASSGYLNSKGDGSARSLSFAKTIERYGQTIPVLGVCD